jgi:hypothetical protein
MSMKRIRSDLALHRILDALEADLLAARAEEIHALAAETGMSAKALLSDAGRVCGFIRSASPLEGEVGDAQHRRVGGMVPPSRWHGAGGDSTPHPDLRSDLPLKGGGG